MSFLLPFLRFFFNFFFKLLYHQFAWTYDWVAAIVSVGLWKDWVLAVLPHLEGPSVLELGHGPGHLQTALLNRGILAYGLDASPQMGRLARRRLHRKGQSVQLLQARAQSLPLASGSFDQVVATFPTEYIIDPGTLKEAWRVLLPGGRMVVLPVAWITGQRWMERFAAALFRITKQSPNLPHATSLSRTPNGLPPAQSQPYNLPGEAADPLEDLQVHIPLVDSLKEAGFQVLVEWKTLRSSTLIVILGEKPSP